MASDVAASPSSRDWSWTAGSVTAPQLELYAAERAGRTAIVHTATGQIAGGANLICFTTGRGSCFGSYPAPTIKLASNTAMYQRMAGDMEEVRKLGLQKSGAAELDEKVVHPHAPAHSRIRSAARF